MNEEKMLELQFLMKQNQADAMDFIADLKGWTTQVKEKERQLQNVSANLQSISLNQESQVSKEFASNTNTDKVASNIVKPISKSHDEASKKELLRINVREVFAEDDAIFKNQFNSTSESTEVCTTKSNSDHGNPSENGDYLHEKDVAKDCSPNLKLSEREVKSINGKLIDTDASVEVSHRIPTSSFQFQADWKRLRGKPAELGIYFKNIDPNSFRQIFGESLEPEMLSGIIDIVYQYFKSDPMKIYEILKHLSEVSRFYTMIMFLPASDKSILCGLFQILEECSTLNVGAVQVLRETYGVK